MPDHPSLPDARTEGVNTELGNL